MSEQTESGRVLSAAEREDAIECIAQALSGAYFDFGVGGRDAEVNEGRKIGEHVIDALELWGWTILPPDTEADAPHQTTPTTESARVRSAAERGHGKTLYAIQYEMGWRHWEGLSADERQHYHDDAAALIEAYLADHPPTEADTGNDSLTDDLEVIGDPIARENTRLRAEVAALRARAERLREVVICAKELNEAVLDGIYVFEVDDLHDGDLADDLTVTVGEGTDGQ